LNNNELLSIIARTKSEEAAARLIKLEPGMELFVRAVMESKE
jgi:hypothetical protein